MNRHDPSTFRLTSPGLAMVAGPWSLPSSSGGGSAVPGLAGAGAAHVPGVPENEEWICVSSNGRRRIIRALRRLFKFR
eukprot:7100354-Pyramimonas_sp.AAC.1